MPWEDYELYATVQPLPLSVAVESGYTPEGTWAFRDIDRRIGKWYRDHREAIDGLYIFHYRDAIADPSRIPQAAVLLPAAPFFAESLRLRFRATNEDTEFTVATLHSEVLSPLSAGSNPVLKGWRRYEGYSAREDVGARYGDLANGVDPTEIVVRILTANTELRFYFLEHPEFLPNHDITHLYLSTMGLTLRQEVEAFRQCIERVEGWEAKFGERLKVSRS